MATTKLAIHVLPDVRAESVIDLASLLAANPKEYFSTSKELVDFLVLNNIKANDWVTSTSGMMKILEKKGDHICLSPFGKDFARIREDAKGDLLHFLMYTGWNSTKPLEFLQSWAYRYCCDLFWSKEEVELSSNFLNQLVEDVINVARDTFIKLGVQDFDEISFSRKSLNGVQNWLEALKPPVINSTDSKMIYRRRAFCPPELMAMAIGYILRDEADSAIEIDILLTPEKREALCRIGQLSPDTLDRTLDWAIPTYPEILSPGTAAGFYGRFIRLHRMPTFENITR